jgi:hypothetical protein
MKTGARKPREIATTVEINGSLHGPLHENFQLSRSTMDEERRQIGYQGKHYVRLSGFAPPRPKNNHEVLNFFLSFITK